MTIVVISHKEREFGSKDIFSHLIRMPNTVVFNKTGYDPFIDFIKAYAIICVLIGHTFPNLNYIGYGLWAGMQVPLFVLVQAFHYLKKDNSIVSLKRIFWRIFFPFIFVEIIIFAILFWIYHYNLNELIHSYLIDGGTGPGSYYPWIYLQIALLLPLFNIWMKQLSKCQLAVAFLVICEGLEFVASMFDFPDWIYRLLAVRYFFLIFLAWIWVEDGITINAKTTAISLLSMLSILYFEYYSINDEPLFYNTAWRFHRWPCYYFVAVLGTYLLCLLWQWISKSHFVETSVKILARCSYEIFLIQMAVCATFPSLSFIHNEVFRITTRTVFIFAISLIGGYLFNRYYKALVLKKINKQ